VHNVDDATQQELAAQLFNRSWELLDKSPRTSDEDVELLTVAFSSRYHWSFVGSSEQFIVGDWMVSRAAADVGEGQLALTFAQRAYDAAQNALIPDWLSASVCEGLARAYAAIGDSASRTEWFVAAQQLITLIDDDEDRELIASQLASVPW
jgi:hypothetical protein